MGFRGSAVESPSQGIVRTHSLIRQTPVVGIAGSIGAGKSTVAHLLASLGAGVFDSDRLGHEVLAEPEVVRRIVAWWGEGVCRDGVHVDRARVAQEVFNSPDQLARLERLLYPRIAERRRRLMKAYEADRAVRAIVLDSPKLFEAGIDALCDAIIVVDAPRAMRLKRVRAQRGWTSEDLARREKQQIPFSQKRARADYLITNNSDLGGLRASVGRVFHKIIASRAG